MTTIVRPDFLIRSPQGYPIAVVEVQNLQDLTRDEATELRRSLIAYGVPSQIPYFLLLSQDIGFLWKESKQESPDAPPTYEFPMDTIVTRYLQRDSKRRLYQSVLALVVRQWLNDLTMGSQEATEEPEKTLALAGFNESISPWWEIGMMCRSNWA